MLQRHPRPRGVIRHHAAEPSFVLHQDIDIDGRDLHSANMLGRGRITEHHDCPLTPPPLRQPQSPLGISGGDHQGPAGPLGVASDRLDNVAAPGIDRLNQHRDRLFIFGHGGPLCAKERFSITTGGSVSLGWGLCHNTARGGPQSVIKQSYSQPGCGHKRRNIGGKSPLHSSERLRGRVYSS